MTHVHVQRHREAQERAQREHELNEALEAARRLQARLELLGDRAADVAIVRSLRDSLARDMAEVRDLRHGGPRWAAAGNLVKWVPERFRAHDDVAACARFLELLLADGPVPFREIVDQLKRRGWGREVGVAAARRLGVRERNGQWHRP